MCRIAGMIDRSLPTGSIEALVKEMCSSLKAGGPDDEGIYSDDDYHLVLGNRRLSIIDLTLAGHQPMSYANQRYWITYNGELYNYPELKEELKAAGCRFSSSSDTEVILAAFATWGIAAFKRFNGMFAFALWDAASASIYLVRDSSGIKPLYYAITHDGLVFASEVRAFAQIPRLQKKNPHWPVYMMAYGHLPEPITTLKDVQPLEKGTWLQYHATSGEYNKETFNRYSYLEKISDRKEAIQLVKGSLGKAVKRHLLSDAPIGVFLSGGLDSSIVALLAQRDQVQLNTISLYFEQERFSEKKYQDILQKDLTCNHYQHLLKEEEFHEFFPSIINTMDLPSCDGINTWFISKYARENGLKAVLSGVGGDELYGGYPSFNRIKAALFFGQFPDSLLRVGRFGAGIKGLRRLVYLSIEGPVGKYLFLRGHFTPNEIAAHLGADETEIWSILSDQPHLPDIDHMTPQNQASWIETNMYMQNQLLRDSDVMSMAHGLEIRVPFLDEDFIRLSLEINSDIKYKGGSKQLLVDSFKDILPESIWNRPKMGFSFPFKEWLSRDEFASDIMRKNGTNRNYKKFIAGNMHWSQYLTAMLIEHHK